MFPKLLFFCVLIYITINAQSINNPKKPLNKTDKSFFIENKGQWAPEVKYLARIGGMNAWITNSGVVYDYYKINRNLDKSKMFKMTPVEKREYENKNTSIQGHVVRLQLVNSENNITGVGNNQRAGYYNYFIGNDKSKWASYVHLYDNVELQGVYKDIDVKYYYDNGMLRYDYKAKPGADISQIKFKFEGQDGISINLNGEIVLKTSIGEVTNGKIYAYQLENGAQKVVPCRFEQKTDGTIGLKTENYDAKKELIIDPLVYSTFIGGNNFDTGYSIAIDAIGDAYITGVTQSPNYPVVLGAYQASLDSKTNAFISKLNSAGSDLIYSTYIGAPGGNIGYSMAIDIEGNTYITGSTNSGYPTTSTAFQTTGSGVFISKINSEGSVLTYSTIIGENNTDYGSSIAIDKSGNAYITGNTVAGYPTTAGAYNATGEGVFVTKLNSTGSDLIYSTYIGDGLGTAIAIDSAGNAYITGSAYSSNYPTTKGAFQDSLDSNFGHAFVTKLNQYGTGLIYSTYIGGISQDNSNSIAVDENECAYIAGRTCSFNFPTTPGTYQSTLNSSGGNAYITKLNSSGSSLIYSTLIGGSSEVQANTIALDRSGNAYIAGSSGPGCPTTQGAFQDSFQGIDSLGFSYNAFITKINNNGSLLYYSTYLGGNNFDDITSIAIDANEIIYVTGQTTSINYPTTAGSYQPALDNAGNVMCFITKLDISSNASILFNNPVIPNKFILSQNFPNPFNPTTNINYSVAKTSPVTIKLYDLLGREKTTLVNEVKNAGNYSVQFSANKGYSSGIYLYRMQAGNFNQTRKLILLK